MDNKFILGVIVVVVAFLGGIIVFKDDSESTSVSVPASNHVIGAEQPKVVLTEYGDFECPACALYYPVLEEVKEKYKDSLQFQYRHFPLVALHPNAMIAHRAAEAAGLQGQFFEMHDLMYQNQQMWNSQATQNPTSIFESYAQQLGLDVDQFKTDMASSSVNAQIQADIAAGNAIGASGTPTFAINGERIETPDRTLESFSAVIDAALEESTDSETEN